jgi:hypothetical protein
MSKRQVVCRHLKATRNAAFFSGKQNQNTVRRTTRQYEIELSEHSPPRLRSSM